MPIWEDRFRENQKKMSSPRRKQPTIMIQKDVSGQRLAKLITYLSMASSRDKTYRFSQYFLTFIKCMMKRSTNFNCLADRVGLLAHNIFIVRKLLRFSQHLETVYDTRRVIRDQRLSLRERFCIVLANLSATIFYFLDHILYFALIGVLKIAKDKMVRIECYSNCAMLAESLLRGLNQLWALNQVQISKLRNMSNGQNGSNGNHNKSLTYLYVDSIKSILDALVLISLIRRDVFGETTTSFLGSIVSAIGMGQLWHTSVWNRTRPVEGYNLILFGSPLSYPVYSLFSHPLVFFLPIWFHPASRFLFFPSENFFKVFCYCFLFSWHPLQILLIFIPPKAQRSRRCNLKEMNSHHHSFESNWRQKEKRKFTRKNCALIEDWILIWVVYTNSEGRDNKEMKLSISRIPQWMSDQFAAH